MVKEELYWRREKEGGVEGKGREEGSVWNGDLFVAVLHLKNQHLRMCTNL